jgi:hypothetical protein
MSDDNGEIMIEQPAPLAPPAAPAGKRPGWLNRLLWLGPRVADARETTFTAGQPGFFAYDVARQICDDVVKIGETGKGSWAVLMLDCTAVELLVRAHLARAGLTAGTEPMGDADWAKARTLPALEAAWGKLTLEQSATLQGMLGPERDVVMARLNDDERASFAAGLHELVMRLAEPLEVEANRLGRALFARWSRILVLAVVVLVAAGLGGKWLSKKLGRPNVALHAAVSVSSQFPGQGTDHALLTDGDPDTLGFHTLDGGQQWVVLDLGKPRKFDRIVVYNRPDGFEDRAVPLKVEVSNDNTNWKQVVEKKESFEKWSATGLKAEGRYVRLKNTPPNFFHLAEIELY